MALVARALGALVLVISLGVPQADAAPRKSKGGESKGGESKAEGGRNPIDASLAFGFTSVGSVFDQNGESQDLGNGSFTEVPLELRARYKLAKQFAVALGFSVANVSPDSSTLESKFGLRELSLGGHFFQRLTKVDRLEASLFFKLDLGQAPSEAFADGVAATSDGQHAIFGELAYKRPIIPKLGFRLRLGFTYHFEGDSFQSGMVIDPQLGVVYMISPSLDIGVHFGWLFRTENAFNGETVPDSSGNVLHVMPTISYYAGKQFSAHLSLGTYGEDAHVGFPIVGKNADKPVGVTLIVKTRI